MIVRTRPRAVLLGRLTTMPFGGVFWQTLHYLVGLERLGFDAYYVEAHAVTPRHFMNDPSDDGVRGAVAYLEAAMDRFGFSGRWAFHALHADGECHGLSVGQLSELYESASVLINLHGGTLPRPEHVAGDRLVCVATDPVELELELDRGVPASVDFFDAHHAVFSFGENYGRPEGGLPASNRFPIRPTRQPVVMELWEGDGATVGEGEVFTTVANWRQERRLRYEGEVYEWSKHFEFLKVIDLPSRTRQPLELALSRCPEEHRRMLVEHGWYVSDALEVSTDLDSYRRYIQSSRGEFTVAKDQNVRLSTGWFSDRSATYLASGRPVVTQDTGLSGLFPTGEGLFTFTTVDEAAEAIEEINADYSRHRRAASEIAREYFAHDVVLPSLLERAGIDLPRRRPVPADPAPRRVLLVAHRFPPDAVGGVERYTENLARSLAETGSAVSVLSRRPASGPLRREIERWQRGVTVHRLAGGRLSRDRFLLDRQECERLFCEVLAETDPEVVHFNHVLDLSPGMLRIARQRGAAVVLTLHDYFFACHRIILRRPTEEGCEGPEGGRRCAETCFAAEDHRAIERWSLRTTYFRRLLGLADRLICPSPYVSEYFAGFGVERDRLRVVPNGVWVERASARLGERRESGDEGLELAFLGAALPHKGLDVVLGALEEAALPAVGLTVFGPMGERGSARELYQRADGIPGLRFRMYGEYEPRDLPMLLTGIDCVVVPSRWPETFCLVAREAHVRGIPVVVARSGALPDGVVNEVNGFVFEPERTDELAAILRRLALEDGLLEHLRAGALATRVPTQAEHVAGVLEAYREALEERRRRAPSASDLDEIAALESALEAVGFGAPPTETIRPAAWRPAAELPSSQRVSEALS